MIDYSKLIKYKTPLYVFDINVLKKRINYLKSKIDAELVYAVKANTYIPKEIEKDVSRFEICSNGEFEICEKLNINPKKMVISGVYKDEKSISNMMANHDIGIYTIESMEQFKLLEKLCKKYNKKVHVLIRLTSNNQFGVNEEEVKEIIKTHKNLIIEGIEYFSGTQKTSLKKIQREVDYLYKFVEKIEEELEFTINEIEYGLGLPVYYFKEEKEFDENNFLKEVNTILQKLRHKKLLIELGRSITASCGYFLTSVVDMKSNKNGNHVILDGGINHLIYYGQTMAMRIPYFDVYPKRNTKKKTVNLFGSLCTINDIILKNIEINELQIGDCIIFKNVGAYSMTEGISLFLSRDLPAVVIYGENGKYRVVRKHTKTSKANFPNYKMEEYDLNE